MSSIHFNIKFEELSQDPFLRNDEKYHAFSHVSDWNLFQSKTQNLIVLRDILVADYKNFKYQNGIEYKGVPTGQSYLDEDGDICDFQIVTLDDHPGRLKYEISSDNILISSLRLAKSPALCFDGKDVSGHVFSNGFYIFKVRDGWNKKFVLHILRTKRLKQIIDEHIYRGIGISAYREDDLLRIKIPLLSREKQDEIVARIEPIERSIRKLKESIKTDQEIMNGVFAQAFRFDLDVVYKADKEKTFFQTMKDSTENNRNFRSSYRWHKLVRVREVLYRDNSYLAPLGKFILGTKNGWSPECNENEDGQAVLGIDAIQKMGVLSFGNLKFTEKTRSDVTSFFVKDGEFFVSRGNTIDLVALASVACIGDDLREYVYPDLMIKVDLDESALDKHYLACVFNSVIGRMYFKYAAKGKNQTMVKISSEELHDFILPVPSIEIQRSIVEAIRSETDAQEVIRSKIADERVRIDRLIEDAVV